MSLSIWWRNGPKSNAGLDFKGSSKMKGHEGDIEVIAMSHEIVSPRDAASGLASGKRQHKPFIIEIEANRIFPMLQQALCRNDTVKTAKFSFYQNRKADLVGSASALEVNCYDIDLVNATICSTELVMLNNKNPDLMKYEFKTRVAFTYQKITWTWKEGGITSEDDWEVALTG